MREKSHLLIVIGVYQNGTGRGDVRNGTHSKQTLGHTDGMTREPSWDLEHEFNQVPEATLDAFSSTEEALRDSEERYRLLLDGIQDYAIFMIDPQGLVLSWNAGAERIKGYKAEEIIGNNLSCFFPEEDIERRRPE